jgi:3-hydroxy-9,10-secoandrosta-1,3,5(10)-triene-9,17-dione monooxygenase
MSATVTTTPLTDRVRAVLPEIEARAVQTEAERRMLDENVALLKELGLFRALVPSSYGGSEDDILDFLQSVRAIASVCPATGWTAGVLAIHAKFVAHYDQRVQEEIWGATGPDTLISTAGVGGSFEPVDGGILLSGRWHFSSGSDHAQWALPGVLMPEAGSDLPQIRLVAVPRSDFVVDDVWFTAGMRGTGSKDLVIENAFVPEYRFSNPLYDMAPRSPGLHPGGLYQLPFAALFSVTFAATILGASEGAFATQAEAVKAKLHRLTGVASSEYPPTQIRLARSLLDLNAAARVLEHHWNWLSTAAREGLPVTVEDAYDRRAQDVHAVELCLSGIDRLIEGAGGTAYYDTNKLQRHWRDIHTASGHRWLSPDSAMHIAGRQLLDIPTDPRLF